MSDLTITIPLSWLSFLTWSGFWVVYLYVGLGWLVFGMCRRVIWAMQLGHRVDVMRHWQKNSQCMFLAVAFVVLCWPFACGYIAYREWKNKP